MEALLNPSDFSGAFLSAVRFPAKGSACFALSTTCRLENETRTASVCARRPRLMRDYILANF